MTAEPATSKDGLDESRTFISGKEPLGYHPKTGRYPDLYNHFGNKRMKHRAYLVMLAAGLFAGCASSRSVLCIAPQGPFSPQSEAALLSELNSHLPFEVSKKQFIAKEKSGGLVGWAVVRTGSQVELAKAKLEESTTLRLLQVEALSPEFEAIMRQHKR